MNGIKRSEVFAAPQKERPKRLETVVVDWMNQLAADEKLIIGLPEVLDHWVACTPLVVESGAQEQFKLWVRQSEAAIIGPQFMLPALKASFCCIVVNIDYDPRREGAIPKNLPRELFSTLTALATALTQHDVMVA